MELKSLSTKEWNNLIEKHHEAALMRNKSETHDVDSFINLAYYHITDNVVEGMELNGIELVRCLIENVQFISCSFSGSLFVDNTFNNCSFHNCNLRKLDSGYGGNYNRVSFRESSFIKASFDTTILQHADFVEADLTGCSFIDADVRFANFEDSTLIHTYFINTKFFTNKKMRVKSVKDIVLNNVTLDSEGSGEVFSGLEALDRLFYI